MTTPPPAYAIATLRGFCDDYVRCLKERGDTTTAMAVSGLTKEATDHLIAHLRSMAQPAPIPFGDDAKPVPR